MNERKRGRPLGKKYPVEYRIRMTNEQWDILNDQADKKGVTIAEYMRSIIMKELAKVVLEGYANGSGDSEGTAHNVLE